MVPSRYLDSYTAFSLSIAQTRNNGQVDFALIVPIQMSDYYNGINLIDACLHDVIDIASLSEDGLDSHSGSVDSNLNLIE